MTGRTVIRVAVTLVSAGMLVNAVAETDQGPAVKALDDAIKVLRKERDEMAKDLSKRIKADAKKGVNRDIMFRLDEGADREEAYLFARQRGGEFVNAYGIVPMWRQEDFHEVFKWIHRGRNDQIRRNIMYHSFDPAGLTVSEDGITGTMTANWLLDKTKDDLFPPGTPRRWKTGQTWTTLEWCAMVNHQKKQVQKYEVNAKMIDGTYDFELFLPNAILNKKYLHVRFQVPAHPWVRGEAWATDWNCGYHSIDAAYMTFENGVLEGPLMIALNPDAWYPKRPQYMVYNISARLDGRKVSGTFESDGDMEGGKGPLYGEGGKYFAGTYDAEGDFGKYHSLIYGRMMPVREDIMKLLVGDFKQAAEGSELQQKANHVAALYRDIRALKLATEQYPLPIERALAMTGIVGPVWETITPEAVTAAVAYADRVQELLKLADDVDLEKDVVVGAPYLDDKTFGPFGVVSELPASEANTNAFEMPVVKSDGPQKWAFNPRWQVLKSVECVDELESNLEKLPDIIPVEGTAIDADMNLYRFKRGQKIPERILETWEPMDTVRGRADVTYTGRGNRGAITYFRTTLHSGKDQDIWVCMRAKAHGKLWVNGKLAWTGSESRHRSQDQLQAIFKISLKKGDNDLLVRVRKHRRETVLWTHFCLQGSPNKESKSEVVDVPENKALRNELGTLDGYFHSASGVPLAWDYDKGINISYKVKLPGMYACDPVAVNGKLFITCKLKEKKDQALVCVDQKNGKVLWQKTGWLPEGRFEGVRVRMLCNDKLVAIGFGNRVTGFDMDGNQKWQITSDVRGDRFYWGFAGDKLIVESRIPDNRLVRTHHVCTAYSLKSGKEMWKQTIPSPSPDHTSPVSRLVRLKNGDLTRDIIVLASLDAVDPETGEILAFTPDADPARGPGIYLHEDMLIMATRMKTVAVRYMLDPNGQVVARTMWKVRAEGKANDRRGVLISGRYVCLIGTVAEDTKGHSPCPVRQVETYDRETGRPIHRIKRAMFAAGLFGYEGFYVDGYLGMWTGGGGSDGNAIDYGQLVWVNLGEKLSVVTRNKIHMAIVMKNGKPVLGTGGFTKGVPLRLGCSRPTFDGNRMFTATGDDLLCHAKTKGGERYEQEQIAKVLFDRLWDIPKDERYVEPARLAEPPPFGTVPISRYENLVGFSHWMVAGPYPLPEEENAAAEDKLLAGIIPAPGDKLELGGVSRKFEPLPQEAVQCRYGYSSEYYLCGMGGTTAYVKKNLDVLSCTGGKKDMSGVIYTVVESTRPRVATLLVPEQGVEVWMGGIKLKPYQTIQIQPGAYPLLVRLRPDKMGKKPKPFQVAFRDLLDSRAKRQTWLKKVLFAEDKVKAVARNLAGSELGDKAERYLAELGEYKAKIDEAQLVRSVMNGGSAMYLQARPPAPWEREANLKWRIDMAAEASASPVASGDTVYVPLKNGSVAAYSRTDGSLQWTYDMKGKAIATPAVSKDAVYVVDAGGTLAKLRFDGSEVWTVKVNAGDNPVCMVAGSTVVVRGKKLLGISMADGKTIWDTKSGKPGMPLVTTFEGKPAVATSDGRILNARQGAEMLDDLPESGDVPPQIVKGVYYTHDDDKVTATDISSGKPEKLWDAGIGGDAVGMPLVLDGMVYVSAEDNRLYALQAADGKIAGKTKLPASIRKEQTQLLFGGERLFVTGLGDGTANAVFKPLGEPKLIWEYDVKNAEVAPTFLGNAAYLAGGKALFAMAGRSPRKPEDYTPPPTVPTPQDYTPGEGVPAVEFTDNTMPMEWLISTPIEPMTLETDFLEPIGGIAKARPEPKQKFKSKKADAEIGWRHFKLEFGSPSHFKHPQFTGGFDSICVRTAADPNLEGGDRLSNKTLYMYTVIDNVKDRYVELKILTPGGEKWNGPKVFGARYFMSGVEVTPGQTVKMQKGKVPILMQVKFTTCNSGGKIWMAPRLTDYSTKYEAEVGAFETAKRVWDAYQAAKDTRFVLE